MRAASAGEVGERLKRKPGAEERRDTAVRVVVVMRGRPDPPAAEDMAAAALLVLPPPPLPLLLPLEEEVTAATAAAMAPVLALEAEPSAKGAPLDAYMSEFRLVPSSAPWLPRALKRRLSGEREDSLGGGPSPVTANNDGRMRGNIKGNLVAVMHMNNIFHSRNEQRKNLALSSTKKKRELP